MKTLLVLTFFCWAGLSTYAQQRTTETESQDVLFRKAVRVKNVVTKKEPDGDAAADAKDPVFNAKLRAIPLSSLKNVSNWKTVNRVGSDAVFMVENDAPGITTARAMSGTAFCAAPVVPDGLESVFAGVKAFMPLYLPYKSSKVSIWQGYYYSWDKDNDGSNDMHGAIDYGLSSVSAGSDPTFGVYAIAPGKVLDVYWSNGGGNIVEIEHTAPNGYKYRSKYLHLRNGYTNDRNNAKNSPTDKYKKFANSNTSSLCWGTNSQTIKVKKGDNVNAGEFIAWAGNTGSGGIGVILKDDGTFTNPNTTSFNVHLHFEVRVQDTRPGKTNDWVRVDPYGTYNSASVDCYDLDAFTPYNRLFAPFYSSFHNVPLDLINKFWGYYTGMGMALQTISVDKGGNTLYAAGSFQWGLPNAWYARFYMKGNTYQQYFNEYGSKGFRPKQISVTKDGSNNPRFSVIWEKNPAGENSYSVHNRDDADFNKVWKEYIEQKKWHVAEHVDYTVNNKRYHAAVFVNKPNNNGFYLYYGFSANDFNKKFQDLYSKWEMISIHVNGSKVGGVWRPKKNNYATYFGMTSASYQQKFNQFGGQGLRLIKVQNYSGNSRFAAIWGK